MSQLGFAHSEQDIIFVPKHLARPGLTKSDWRANVLLVEDDDADTELIVDALRRNPDVRSIAARSQPAETLFELACGGIRPTIILLDIHMPQMDGFEFVDTLRHIPSMRDIPVVLLTTSGLARDVERARYSSVCGYLVKPDTVEGLRDTLDRLIKRAIAGDRRN